MTGGNPEDEKEEAPMAQMKRGTFLKVRKTREGSAAEIELGQYYITDEFRRAVVDSGFPTLSEARAARTALKEDYPGTVQVH